MSTKKDSQIGQETPLIAQQALVAHDETAVHGRLLLNLISVHSTHTSVSTAIPVTIYIVTRGCAPELLHDLFVETADLVHDLPHLLVL